MNQDYDDGRGGMRMLSFVFVYCAIVFLVIAGTYLSCR